MARSIITKVEVPNDPEVVYPSLWRSSVDGMLLLLSESGVGTVVHAGSGAAAVGTHQINWSMADMRVMKIGTTVTLTQN